MGKELAGATSVIIGVDVATNVFFRSMSNIIAHDPRPWFVESLKADLKKGSATELLSKIGRFVGKPVVSAFISDSCNIM
jgi:hypothetical protein